MEAEVRADILRRLGCIGGHTRALSRMIADQEGCLQIVHQINAVQGSLKKVKLLLIEDYLLSGLPDSIGALTHEEHSEIISRCEELFVAAIRD